MVDPSNFTLPYDTALCGALGRLVDELVLVCRPLRDGEDASAVGYQVLPAFYRASERLAKRVSHQSPLKILKGLEHFISMVNLATIVRSRQPHIVHFQWPAIPIVDQVFIRLIRRNIPVVLTIHDSKPFHGNASFVLQTKGWHQLARLCDHIIVLTKFTKTNVEMWGIHPSKISVVPIGILWPQPYGQAPLRPLHSDGISGRIVIVLWGSIKHYKGVDVLLRAIALMPPHHRNRIIVRVAGKAYIALRPLEELAKRLGVSEYLRWEARFIPQQELHQLLSLADILVFPYRDIDASAAVMASIPFAKPIVASRIGGLAEILENGKHGYLVPPEDPLALAAALTELVADPDLRRRMGEEVRRLAESIPSWHEIAAATLQVYNRVISERRHLGEPRLSR